MQWYGQSSRRDASTLSQAELQQLALSSPYYPLGQYPSYPPTSDLPSSSLVADYGAVSDHSSLAPVTTKLEPQAASATYTTPLGMTRCVVCYTALCNVLLDALPFPSVT